MKIPTNQELREMKDFIHKRAFSLGKVDELLSRIIELSENWMNEEAKKLRNEMIDITKELDKVDLGACVSSEYSLGDYV